MCFDHQNLIVLYLEVGLGQQGTKSSLGNIHSSCNAQPRAGFAIQEGTCKASVKGVALQHISILTQFCQWPNASKIKLGVRQPAQAATTPVTCFSVPWVCSACSWWGPGCRGGCALPGAGAQQIFFRDGTAARAAGTWSCLGLPSTTKSCLLSIQGEKKPKPNFWKQ